MSTQKLSISIDPSVVEEIDARVDPDSLRGERSTVISRDLERYYAALKDARRRLRDTLSPAELSAVLDNCNGVLWTADTLQLLWANVQDGIAEGLAEKWEIDGATLVTKLQALSYAESCALIDAAERWWRKVGAGENPDIKEALRS